MAGSSLRLMSLRCFNADSAYAHGFLPVLQLLRIGSESINRGLGKFVGETTDNRVIWYAKFQHFNAILEVSAEHKRL